LPLSEEALEGLSREELVAMPLERSALIARLESKVAELEAKLGRNSGNSSTPPSGDPVGERQRQAQERAERQARTGQGKRRRAKQGGARGHHLELSRNPDVIVDHLPQRCECCGEDLAEGGEEGYASRQVVELPEVTPVVTEPRAHRRRCRCGQVRAGAFPDQVRAPVSDGKRVTALVAYLLARQHRPGRRVAQTMADCFGPKI
jgi:transposase